MADNERDDLINGLEEITPDDIENDDRLMKLVASILVEEEKRSGSYFWRLIDIYGLTA